MIPTKIVFIMFRKKIYLTVLIAFLIAGLFWILLISRDTLSYSHLSYRGMLFLYQIQWAYDPPWSARTLIWSDQTITYEFGKGNPPEVALTGAELEAYRHGSNRGYMIPEAEMAMQSFLSSKGFQILATACRSRIEWYNSPDYPQYHFSLGLTMESMMYIDPSTGRKEFDPEKYQGISTFWYIIDNPLEDDDKQMWRECMNPETHRKAKEAMEKYSDATRYYHLGVHRDGSVVSP